MDRLALCGALAAILAATGCTAVGVALPMAAGAGNLAFGEYRAGEYVLVVDASRADCALALQQTCQDFGLAVTAWREDLDSTEVTARHARGDRFRVLMSDVACNRTALYIRAGFWGDDLCSRQLACDITENVKKVRRAVGAMR
jgi:hypothetical protein